MAFIENLEDVALPGPPPNWHLEKSQLCRRWDPVPSPQRCRCLLGTEAQHL